MYIIDALLGLGLDATTLFVISCVLTGVAFVVIGLVKGRMTKTNQLKAGLETLLLGGIAAVLAYALGDLLAKALAAS